MQKIANVGVEVLQRLSGVAPIIAQLSSDENIQSSCVESLLRLLLQTFDGHNALLVVLKQTRSSSLETELQIYQLLIAVVAARMQFLY